MTIGSGEGGGLSVRVEGDRFLIGSGPECQLLVGDPKAAPLRAYFEVGEGGRVVLHDLGSGTGTLVDGERLEGSRTIEGGEEIRIGDTVLVPSVADPAEEARDRAEHAHEEPEKAPAVRVRTEDGQTVEVLAASEGDDEGTHASVRVATDGEAVEVVPGVAAASARPLVSGLVSEINGARVGSTFAGYCDAVRTIGSGQTAVLTIQTRPNHAPKQLQVKFL